MTAKEPVQPGRRAIRRYHEKELADLQIGYEKVEPYPLMYVETSAVAASSPRHGGAKPPLKKPFSYRMEDKMRLSKPWRRKAAALPRRGPCRRQSRQGPGDFRFLFACPAPSPGRLSLIPGILVIQVTHYFCGASCGGIFWLAARSSRAACVYHFLTTSIAGLPHGVSEVSSTPPNPLVPTFHQYMPSNHGWL
jgi:hypothetical protein